MDQMDYMLHREEYEKDIYERQQAFKKLEARWPKWIKYSANSFWAVMVVLGFLWHGAMGAMLGFVIGGGISLLYERICRYFVGKKLGIKDVRGDKAIADLIEEQNKRREDRLKEGEAEKETPAAETTDAE